MGLYYSVYDTAAGDVTIVSNEKCLVNLYYGAVDPEGASNEETVVLYDAITELNQYCYGQRKVFDLRLAPQVSDLDKRIYEEILKIPYGRTAYCEDIAKALGEVSYTKAVVNAIEKNPLPLFIPCHRVIGKNGASVSYVGGLDLKKKLLSMERSNVGRVFAPGDYSDPE